MNDFILKTIGDSCRGIGRLNTKTSIIEIYKEFGQTLEGEGLTMPVTQYIDRMIEENRIYEEDIWQFRLLKLPVNILPAIMERGNGSSYLFRRKEKDKLVWCRFLMMFPNNYGEENPDVLVLHFDMAEGEALNHAAMEVMGRIVHKIVKINFNTEEVKIIREYPSEHYMHQKQKETGYSMEVQFAKEKFIHPDDEQGFLKHLDHDYIQNYFVSGNTQYLFHYRRRVGTLFRWVKLLILPSDEWSKDNPVFYYYVLDAHKEVLKLMDINQILSYSAHFSKWENTLSESYYDNILLAMSLLTEKYTDYYLVDLEKDLYVKYKIRKANIREDIPFVGTFSTMVKEYIGQYASGESAKKIMERSTPDHLKDVMASRMTYESSYLDIDGVEIKTVVRKMESYRGVPTKLLCYSFPVEEGSNKLRITTFGNFDVTLPNGQPLRFARKQSKALFAYLIDRQGYEVTSIDIVRDVLDKDINDKNAVKYVSTMVRRTIDELTAAGYPDVIIKDAKTIRVNTKLLDCDYYRLLAGDSSAWDTYHNEYMKEYSWAEETNAEILAMAST